MYKNGCYPQIFMYKNGCYPQIFMSKNGVSEFSDGHEIIYDRIQMITFMQNRHPIGMCRSVERIHIFQARIPLGMQERANRVIFYRTIHS
ncbi:MAG: hypothetical protein LBD59_07800 [Prevotellaceae bacterium]|nr:hypothetical protein [Prevotellaceae bacterium]